MRADRAGAAGLRRRRARRGARARAGLGRRDRGAARRSAQPQGRTVVGLVARQARHRVPVLERRGDDGGAARVRAALRRPGARAAGGGPRRADAGPCGRAARARASRRPLARRRRPSATCATTTGCPWPTRRARVAELVEAGELVPVRRRGLASAGVPATASARLPRRVDARALLSPFDSLVWERDRHRAAVRLPVPHRDLRARTASGCTATTCCRSCSATGSSRGSTSRPTGRPACWSCRRRTRSRTRRSTPVAELVDELRSMASWLGLDSVVTAGRGDLPLALPPVVG